jgi:hypothetical protein
MAIHAGEVADVGDELFGMALHLASRILAVAHGGQIVVSDAAVGLIAHLAPDISLLDLRAHRLRDIVRPVRLHQVVVEGIATVSAWSSWRASALTRWCPRPCSGRSACASRRLWTACLPAGVHVDEDVLDECPGDTHAVYGPIRYGRIISWSSCSTMWQCQT